MLSYNNEAWLSYDELHELCAARGHVAGLAFDSARYVGARSASTTLRGGRWARISHLRNTEYLVVAGDRSRVLAMVGAVEEAGLGARVERPVPTPLWHDDHLSCVSPQGLRGTGTRPVVLLGNFR